MDVSIRNQSLIMYSQETCQYEQILKVDSQPYFSFINLIDSEETEKVVFILYLKFLFN